MRGRAYIKTPLLELYIEGEVETDISRVEKARSPAVGLFAFHAVSHFDGVEARRREGWPAAVFIVGRPTTPTLHSGDVALKEEDGVDCEEYRRAFAEAKAALERGELFQLVLARHRRFADAASPDAVLKRLARHMEGKYYFFIQFGDFWVAGVSPETLVTSMGGWAVSGPIGGTRPRGRDAAEDAELERELVESVKERAEHLMLVDSVRNDMGRVCRWGTVAADRVAVVEKYNYVQHLVSYIECRLDKSATPLKAVQALNPTTTVTGVPKPRAIEYINKLEREPRGPFTGSIGAVWPGGADFAVVIRSLYGEGDAVYAWAGAGIVADSRPDAECRETEVKMAPLLRAVQT
ncbi:anthranilate synthase component I family protein [Pyrobaculum sp.]|uniref:anthranilate synthase component I family protein n=1 Tax=Pyrobaculum sp. TaxID=2004705 RepID=UPI003D0D5A92